jgi:hypothetical protein
MKKIKKVVQAALIIAILIAPSLLVAEDRDAFAATTTEQKIVYTQMDTIEGSENQFTADLVVMNKDGSGKVNITNTPDSHDLFPKWSPDGKRIAYIRGVDDNTTARIAIIESDGANQVIAPDGYTSFLSWTKDSESLIYLTAEEANGTFSIKKFNLQSNESILLGNFEFEEGRTVAVFDYNKEKNFVLVGDRPDYSEPTQSCKAYLIDLNGTLEKQLISDINGRCNAMFSSPSGSKIMQSSLVDGSANVYITNTETFEQDSYIGAGTLFEYNYKSPWSQSEEFILIGELQPSPGFGFIGMKLLNVADGSIRKDVSIAGTRNIPWGQMIDNDTNILIDVVNEGFDGNSPDSTYIGIYNIESGQIVNLTGGDEYAEFYSDISSTTSTDNPELPFVDPATIIPPKTGLSVGVVSALVGTLSTLSLVGYGSARKISKRSFSGSER